MRPLTVITLPVCVGLLAGQFYATAAPPSQEPARIQLVGFTQASGGGEEGSVPVRLAPPEE